MKAPSGGENTHMAVLAQVSSNESTCHHLVQQMRWRGASTGKGAG